MANMKTYSKKAKGSVNIAPSFTVKEFACKDGTDTVLIDYDLVVILQKIRDHFGKAVTINSGYRTSTYDKKVGGTGSGYHTKGQAADIVVSGVTPLTVGLFAAELLGNKGGIEIGDSYCHIDTRDTRWRAFTTSGGSNYTTVTDFGAYLVKK